MRRALLVILLLGLTACAPAATAWAATSPETIRTILRDCEDDGTLNGSYRPSELRDAVRNIGTDLDQYSDCRDVISAAVLRAVSRPAQSGGDGGAAATGGTDGAGAVDGAGIGSGANAGTGSTAGGADFGGGALLTPEGPEETAELSRLRSAGPESAVVGGRPVQLGARSLASILALELPVPLLVALALLTVGALVAGLPAMRRLFLDRRAA